jgi:hypothetical protein
MLFTQAAKLEPWFCSADYRPFVATPKLVFFHVVLSFFHEFVFHNTVVLQVQDLGNASVNLHQPIDIRRTGYYNQC